MHRVYRPQTIIDTLKQMQIVEMGYIKGFDVIEYMNYKSGHLIIQQENLDSIPNNY